MKQFDIRLTTDQSNIDGLYAIYYYIGTVRVVAKKYNSTGTSTIPATNLTHSELVNGPGVRVDVPDNISKFVIIKTSFYDRIPLTYTNYDKNTYYLGNNDGFIYNNINNTFSFKVGLTILEKLC